MCLSTQVNGLEESHSYTCMLDAAACQTQPKAPGFFKHHKKLTQDTQQCHMPKQLNPQRYCCENCHHAIINDICSSLVSVQACHRKLTVCLANTATNNCINNSQQRNGFINTINIYYENKMCCPRTLSTAPLLQKTCTSVPIALWR